MIGHVLHSLVHPHGWWILVDVFVLGAQTTLCLVLNDDDKE